MKVWKSPVLYLGLFLILAVIGALAAPYVIDWNSYRADLETYGRKITGREVRVEGNVTARLFPWPRLTLEDVRIANLPGLEVKEFATAERIEVQLTLAGLFSGTFQAETIDIDSPVLTFERNAAGLGNWQFQPVLPLASDDLLGRVKLDRITLRDGTVRLIDRRRGGTIRVDDFDASLSAPDVRGPWRMRALGVYEDRMLDIGFNSGTWKPDEPFRFGIRVANANASGLAYSFDGANMGDHLEGTVRVEPVAKSEGKSDTEGELRPLVLTAKVNTNFDFVAFDDIQIAPQDFTQGGTMMSGSAHITLGAALAATADLKAPLIDLDEIAGARTRSLLREGEGFVLASQLLKMMPEDFTLEGRLDVTSLKAGGQNLENVEIAVAAASDRLNINRFRADLPGRTSTLVEGVFLPGGEGGEFSGTLAAESGDLRMLSSWLWPEGKAAIDRLWTGERGRAKLETEMSLRPSRLRFDKVRYELDGVPGMGSLVVGMAGRRSVDFRIDTDALDTDRYLPPATSAGVVSLWPLMLPSSASPDVRLVVQSGRLLMNGVEAEDIAIDVVSGATGLDLRTVQIGSVEGARLDASGLVIDTGQGSDGSVGIEVSADDPRGLLRLAGILPRDGAPVWAAALGKTSMRGTFSIKPGEGAPVMAVDVSGTTGSLTLSATGTASGDTIKGSTEVKAPDGAGLAQLIGFEPVASDNSPARLTATISGSRAAGFLTDLQIQAFGANFGFNGTAAEAVTLDGTATLKSTNAVPLFAALGLPTSVSPQGVLALDGTLVRAGTQPLKAAFSGRLGETPVSFDGTLSTDRKIAANISVGSVLARDVLAAALLEWNGQQPSPETPFAAGLPFGLEGEVWITPTELRISDIYAARNVQAAISASDNEIRVAVFGKDDSGKDALIEVASKPEGAGDRRAISGKVRLPIDLARHLRLDSGEAAAAGTGVVEVGFSGDGRSPGGALIGLSGSGSYSFDGLEIARIDVAAFKRAAATASDSAGLTAAFDALRSGAGLAFGHVAGSITIVNGVAAFSLFKLDSADAKAEVRTLAELGQGSIDSAVVLNIRDDVERPAMEISFAGSPQSLVRSDDRTELFGQLGVDLMNAGVAELERLREEQERLAIEEEKLRKDDEARLQDYYAQRDELRLRQRETKVHAALRVIAADALRAEIEQSRAANSELNKAELKQRMRELRTRRLINKQAQAALEPPAKPKPKVIRPVKRPVVEVLPEEPLPLPPSQQDSSPSQ